MSRGNGWMRCFQGFSGPKSRLKPLRSLLDASKPKNFVFSGKFAQILRKVPYSGVLHDKKSIFLHL
jgi:hypothetical protein